MKKTIMLVLATLVLGSGCQQDSGKHAVQPENQPQFSVDLPLAHVNILNRSDNVVNGKSVHMGLRVTYPDGTIQDRVLVLAASRTEEDAGFSATLQDSSGALIVGATQRWGVSPDSAVHYFLSESTATDQLELRAVTEESHVRESYTLNGRSFEASYDRATPSELQAQTRFAKFYARSGAVPKLTLDNNIEGSMMMQLLAEPAFLKWLKGTLKHDVPSGAASKPQCDIFCKYCRVANVCSLLKCTYAAPGNYACAACLGAALGCEVASWIF